MGQQFMAGSGLSLIELREMADSDACGEEAAELIGRLVESKELRSESRERAFRFLNEEPQNHSIRLLLAKSFYLDGLGEFCVRELHEIERRGAASESVTKLLQSFGAAASPDASSEEAEAEADSEQGVVAELDLDADFTDALDELLDDDES